MPGTPLEDLARALEEAGVVVAGVGRDQWAAPTPCAPWTVGDLADHLVAGNRLFAGALAGKPATPSSRLDSGGVDRSGDRAIATYRDSADELLAAFSAPGALDQLVPVPFGTVPGIVALHLRVVEALVHGWDLARSTEQPAPAADELAEQELIFTRDNLGSIPPDRTPFGPSQPVADDAPAIDRLAACLGRNVAAPLAGGAGS
jgi:uncharacterized protein (TIGR03086 family)